EYYGLQTGKSPRHYAAHLLRTGRDRPWRDGAVYAVGRQSASRGPSKIENRKSKIRRSPRAEETDVPGEGEVRHLSPPFRRAAHAGHVRLQAQTGRTEHEALPRFAPQGRAVRLHQGRAQDARLAL